MLILRVVLGTIGVASLAASAITIFSGAPLLVALWLFGIGLVLTLGLFFERVHYKMLAPKAPGPDWVATPERFVDPTSGQMVHVYTKPKTGKRLYVNVGVATPNEGQ